MPGLVVGTQYVIDIRPPRFLDAEEREIIAHHPFFKNRVVTFLGIDPDPVYHGRSHIFQSYVHLSRQTKTDNAAFAHFTVVCASYLRNGHWVFHITPEKFTVVDTRVTPQPS